VERVRIPMSGGKPDETKIAESMAVAATCLKALDALASAAPFLVGPHITLADLHALPILLYFSLAEEGRHLLAQYPTIEQWLAMMRSRPSVERTRSRYETKPLPKYYR